MEIYGITIVVFYNVYHSDIYIYIHNILITIVCSDYF